MQTVLQRESAHLHYLLHHLQMQQNRLHGFLPSHTQPSWQVNNTVVMLCCCHNVSDYIAGL